MAKPKPLSPWALAIALRVEALDERGRKLFLDLFDRLAAETKREAAELRYKPVDLREWFGSLH